MRAAPGVPSGTWPPPCCGSSTRLGSGGPLEAATAETVEHPPFGWMTWLVKSKKNQKSLDFLGILADNDVAGIPISGDVPSSSQLYLHVPCFLLNLQQRCLADTDPQRMFIVFRGWLKPTTSLCSICLKLEYHPHQLVIDIPSSPRHIYHQSFHRIAFIPYLPIDFHLFFKQGTTWYHQPVVLTCKCSSSELFVDRFHHNYRGYNFYIYVYIYIYIRVGICIYIYILDINISQLMA